MPTVGVVGSIITDLTVLVPRFPDRGENLLATHLQIGPGGKGANAAVAARRLGAEVVMAGRVGDDAFGHQELEALRKEGVNVDGVEIDPHAPTGTAVILVEEGGENTILVVTGANDYVNEEQALRALAAYWSRLDALLVDFEVPPTTVRAVVEAGRSHGVPVVVDAGPARPYGSDIWGAATVLSPNRLEAATLVGRPLGTDQEVYAAARELLEQGPEAVVVRLGAAGAFVMTRQLEQTVPGFAVPTVDTTGAGDAFMGALLVTLAEGMPLPEAVRWANAAGALATTRLGTLPVMPRREEVLHLLSTYPSDRGSDRSSCRPLHGQTVRITDAGEEPEGTLS